MDSQNETQEFLVKLAQEESMSKLQEDESENAAPQSNNAEDYIDQSDENQQQQQRNHLRGLSEAVANRRLRRARLNLEEDPLGEDVAGNYDKTQTESSRQQKQGDILSRLSLLSARPGIKIKAMSLESEKEKQQALIKNQFRSLDFDLEEDAMDIQKQTQDFLVQEGAESDASPANEVDDSDFEETPAALELSNKESPESKQK
jgi:hypothetical protein